MSLSIFYRYKQQKEETYTTSGNEVLIGRAKDVPDGLDLYPDLKTSRRHAILFYELGTWWVKDLDSKYGTFLHEERITEPTELSPGDELRMGETVLRVEFSKLEMVLTPGSVESIHVHETQPPAAVPEDRYLKILASISSIAAQSNNAQSMLDGFLHEISEAFPQCRAKDNHTHRRRRAGAAHFLAAGSRVCEFYARAPGHQKETSPALETGVRCARQSTGPESHGYD